jgi:hypothetical protein
MWLRFLASSGEQYALLDPGEWPSQRDSRSAPRVVWQPDITGQQRALAVEGDSPKLAHEGTVGTLPAPRQKALRGALPDWPLYDGREP